MSAVDPVAAYEAGVQSCHGAPQRECCVRAGLAAHEQLLREQIARELSPALLAARTAIPDGRLQRGCVVQDGATVRERLRQAYLAIRAGAPEVDYPAEAAGEVVHPGGWGAMLRHGTAEPQCLCVETTNVAELERGQRTWVPGCAQHPAASETGTRARLQVGFASAKAEIRMTDGTTYEIELTPPHGEPSLVGEINISNDIVEIPNDTGWREWTHTGRRTAAINLAGDLKTATRRPAESAEIPTDAIYDGHYPEGTDT